MKFSSYILLHKFIFYFIKIKLILLKFNLYVATQQFYGYVESVSLKSISIKCFDTWWTFHI